MTGFLAAPLGPFLFVTFVMFGAAACAAGRALALGWRPAWQWLPYALLLAAADRFLLFALFEGALLSLRGFLCAVLPLLLAGFAGYRVTQARMMVRQYPWLYEAAGPFGWRKRV
jgi:hypothetical protein